MSSASDFIERCRATLAAAAARRSEEPDVNPVRALAFNISRRLEAGEIAVADVAAAAKQACDEAFRRRAARLASYAKPIDFAVVVAQAAGDDPMRLKALVTRPRAGIVFTAHPTFALCREMRAALAALADDPQDAEALATLARRRHAPEADITVASEHADTQAAIGRTQDALRAANRGILDVLRRVSPDDWRAVVPRLASVASWVGYDFDGRTDIRWSDTFRFRLLEKAAQLRRYQAAADAILAEPAAAAPDFAGRGALETFAGRAGRAAADAEAHAERFAEVDGDPDATAAAANALSQDGEHRLVSAAPLLADLAAALAAARDGGLAEAIWLLRADVASYRLGTAEIHLRVNAAQIRNAARADIDIDLDAGGFGRVALDRAADYAANATPQRVNFASVYVERATARRQLMLAAQIRKHVDADAPIRFLIAETESPVTVLAAVALARRYGVADGVDISPLFETPEALESGGRLMEQLFDEPAYLAYVRKRGRIAIQIGFSDSGRFMGQVAACFAAERLQALVARALARRNIRNLDVVLFNTHGESMGRGAHPGGMRERLRYVFTPWSAARFAPEGIAVVHETSFQGGDGLAHFGTAKRAQRSIDSILSERHIPRPAVGGDRFYLDLNFSWDFYRALMAWHVELREDPDHAAVLSALGRNLLVVSGSRPVKRTGPAAALALGPRSLRAIPHNAILQQFGAPANVACGVGQAAKVDPDRFADLIEGSERAREALAVPATARGLTSLWALRAYAGLYDPSFWSARAHNGFEPAASAPAALIAERLKSRQRADAYERLANLVAADLARFDALLERAPGLKAASAGRAAERGEIELLHGLRIALLMRAALLAARLPVFSDRYDVTRDGLVDLVLDGAIDEAARLLALIFPEGVEGEELLKAIEEPGDLVTAEERGYGEIHERIVNPLRDLLRAVREIGVGISHAYDAYG